MKILTWLTNLAGLSNLSLGSRNLLWLIGNRPGTSELITRTLKHHIGTLETTSRRSESHLNAWNHIRRLESHPDTRNRIYTLGIASIRSELHLDARNRIWTLGIASIRWESHLDARNRIWMLESHLDARNRIWTLGITPRRSESCVELFKVIGSASASSQTAQHCWKLISIISTFSSPLKACHHLP
ncbi:hypothetical protein PSTT_16641 [Puccinia striiformis]|uniref:Uncharacterized protein n=1 Tax=Puccinia striiformis TaxID=27350 RepID=A0A2S4UC52_9BASI|nr:hypothetical protein PSTT_16641 [Puccinia striiformis]